jgi:hypothetical protein
MRRLFLSQNTEGATDAARLLKESCQRDAVLKGHEFQVHRVMMAPV